MNWLEFANPVGWWWAWLALPILGFYILKIRLRRQSVTTLLFWDRLFDEQKPRSWWRELRHWLSLLLQWAFLILLVGALVDPLWSWQKKQRRKLMVVIDNSASMNAVDAGRTRLDRAKQSARALVRSLRPGDEMAVLSAGGRPQVVLGLSQHARTLLDAIDHLPKTDAPTSLHAAVVAAKRLVTGDTIGRIYVLTDGCTEDIAQLQADEQIEFFGFGDRLDNMGITKFQVRRSLADAIGYQTMIEVSNLAEIEQECRLELTLADELVDVVPVKLAAGESRTMNLDQSSATGGTLEARLRIDDALAQDNIARAILPPRKLIPVTLVTPGSLFLKSVLESIPMVKLRIVSELPETLTANEILVLHKSSTEKIPPGRVMVIDPQTSSDLWELGEKMDQPIVASVSDDSPLTRHLSLTNVVFPAAKQFEVTGKATWLVRTPLDDSLLAQIHRPSGDCVLLSVDLDQGDLPLRIAFPVLMKNTIEWFEGTAAELRASVASGEVVNIPLASPVVPNTQVEAADQNLDNNSGQVLAVVESAAGEQVGKAYELISPDGERTPLAKGLQNATVGPLLRQGVWTIDLVGRQETGEQESLSSQQVGNDLGSQSVSAASDSAILIACNLANRQESDLRPRVQLPRADHLALASLGGRSIWFYLAMLALALIVTEWWLYQRRLVG